MTNRLDVVEKGGVRVQGGLVPVIKQPSLGTFLQLFNPFAPAEYGGMRPLRLGQTFSRLDADPIKTGPTSPLISIGDRPVKPETKPAAGDDY
jgi:hypothetical protein